MLSVLLDRYLAMFGGDNSKLNKFHWLSQINFVSLKLNWKVQSSISYFIHLVRLKYFSFDLQASPLSRCQWTVNSEQWTVNSEHFPHSANTLKIMACWPNGPILYKSDFLTDTFVTWAPSCHPTEPIDVLCNNNVIYISYESSKQEILWLYIIRPVTHLSS